MVTGEMKSGSDKTDSKTAIFGPLFLDGERNRVTTVFHTETFLSEDEFSTLYLLAASGEKYLSFENLYNSAWDKGDKMDRRDEAQKGINSVMEQINAAEPEMLWIEFQPEYGYALRLHEVYHKETRLTPGNDTVLPYAERFPRAAGSMKKPHNLRLLAVTLAVFVLIAATVYQVVPELFMPGSAVIEDEPIPLATLDFLIIFPEVENLTIPANTTDVEIHFENPDGNDYCFLFEIALTDTGETLYVSELTEPGASIENITLTKPLANGIYRAWLIIRAFEIETYSEIESKRTVFDLFVN